MSKNKSEKTGFDFEKTLAELNQIVEQIEKGGFKLEESIVYYERGITLARACQRALQEAEQKVKILLEKGGRSTATDFPTEDNVD